MPVEKRGKKWIYRFQHEGEIYCKGGYATATKAEAAENEMRLVLADGLTFSKVADRRMEYVEAYCTPTHYKDTRTILGRFRKEWGHLPLSLITREMINNQILAMAKVLSPNNVNRHIRGLRSMFQMAVNEDLIPKNPTLGIKFLPTTKTARVVPTAEEIKEVLLRANPTEQAFLTIVWQTAARVSEVLTLKWEDVDLEKDTVRLWTRKSKNGNRVSRVVPMLPDAKKAVSFLWKRRVKGSPWVLTNQMMVDRYPDHPEKWRFGYPKKLMKRLDTHIRFHSLRHSTASTLSKLGVELTVIQKILGHARPTTTDIYLSTMPQGVTDGMEKLSSYLEGTHDHTDSADRNRVRD